MEALRPQDPRTLGPYRLRGRLGEGGMGEVFLGVSPSGLRAAVKTVRPEYAFDPGFRDRFRREVAAARRVDSAWTAPIAAADADSDPPWFATEYLTGIPLSDAVATYGPLPEQAVRVLAAQLVEALMAIHRADLVHRDLKPSNVILGRDRPRVIDFGISRALDFATHALTSPGGAIGSPGYMSPEQAAGEEEVDQRTDIFALGGVLVYAATGRTPFGATPQNAMQLLFQIIHGEPKLDGVPESLRGLIAECLAKDPAARPTLDDILRRTVGGLDDAEAAVGGAWLPPALAAELMRRQNADPADSLPSVPAPPPGAAALGAGLGAGLGVDNDELPATRAHNGAEGVTDVLPATPGPGPTALTTPLPPPRPPSATMAATDVFEVANGPAPAAAPSGRPRGLSRRSFLIGGGAVGVAVVGGAAGWLLTRSDGSGRVAWNTPVGPTARTYSVVSGKYLVIAGSGAQTKGSQTAGLVVCLDMSSGKQVWTRSTAAPNVNRPVATKDRVFVNCWAEISDSSAPSKYHSTIYAFSLGTEQDKAARKEPGTIVWQAEHDSLGVHLGHAVEDKVVVVTSPPNTSDTEKAYVFAYDAANGPDGTPAPVYTADSSAPWLLTPWVEGGTALVSGIADSYGDYAKLYKVDLAAGTGEVLWSATKEKNPGPPVVALGRVFVRSGSAQASSGYADERSLCAVWLENGETDWRVPNLPAGDMRRLVVDTPTATVVVLTNGNDQAGKDKVDARIQVYDATTGGRRWDEKPEGLMISDAVVDGATLYVSTWPSDLQSGFTKPTSTPTATATAVPEPPLTTGRVYAFDLKNGTRLWDFPTHSAGELTDPQVANGVVCVGVSSRDGVPAAAFGIDAKTGQQRWKADLAVGRVSGPRAGDGRFHLVLSPGEPEGQDGASVTPTAAATATGSPSAAPATGPGATVYELRP
ncbi:protein kinase domain-containing protein [Yinghuangia sp. YIM S09857]|uniref:serine/threonine-protein kinase n=1 Tax=Yinghuangia sp. YIM S09857 TaxID=3436929 RepID=UPI003F52F87D